MPEYYEVKIKGHLDQLISFLNGRFFGGAIPHQLDSDHRGRVAARRRRFGERVHEPARGAQVLAARPGAL